MISSVSYKYLSRCSLAYVFLIFSYASSFYLSGGTANEGLFTWLYYWKHLSMVVLSVISLIYLNFKSLKVSVVYVFILPFSVYLFGQNWVFFLQFLVFVLGVNMISLAYEQEKLLNKEFPLLLLVIYLSIPVWDLLLNSGGFIYSDTFYGRPRLLLGYFHPKEAGTHLLVIWLVFLLSYQFKRPSSYILFNLVFIVTMYNIQSRNALLFLCNFLTVNWLIKKLGLKGMLLLLFVFIVFSGSLLWGYYDELNVLSSNRLDIWLAALDVSFLGEVIAPVEEVGFFAQKYKFHVDNFYLGFLIEAGIGYFMVLAFLLIYISFMVRQKVINNYRIISLFLSFLVFCFFDAGMFSTGSLLNVFVWSIIMFVLSDRYCPPARSGDMGDGCAYARIPLR